MQSTKVNGCHDVPLRVITIAHAYSFEHVYFARNLIGRVLVKKEKFDLLANKIIEKRNNKVFFVGNSNTVTVAIV